MKSRVVKMQQQLIKHLLRQIPFYTALTVLLAVGMVDTLYAQRASTSSPYSRFGLGQLHGNNLTQNRGMGGIATGVRHLGGYSNINVANPASYSAIRVMTAIEVGVAGSITQLSNSNRSENSYNFSLANINMAVPLAKYGGLSFGMMPFSDVGYSYATPATLDTMDIVRAFAGEGGTTKAYLGYGVQLHKNWSVGFNAGYIFGTQRHINALEYPNEPGALNTKIENTNYLNGLNLDYGVQYFKSFKGDNYLTIGYAGTAGNNINSRTSQAITRTYASVVGNISGLPVDSVKFTEGQDQKITMPMKHSLGFTFATANRWLVGADVNYATWSDFGQNNQNAGFSDSYGFAVGTQWTPDITSIRYLGVIDYRLGFNYNKSFININNQDVKQMGVTVGLGLPLPSLYGGSFYKVNFAAEFGQMGNTSAGMVQERYINFNLGFTLNDRWFMRRQYD